MEINYLFWANHRGLDDAKADYLDLRQGVNGCHEFNRCRISNSTWQSLGPLICRLLLYSKGLWPKDLTKVPKRCQEYVWLESVESHWRLRTITYNQSSSYIWIYVVHTTDSHHPKRAWDPSQKSFQKKNHLETHFWKRNTLFVHGVMGGPNDNHSACAADCIGANLAGSVLKDIAGSWSTAAANLNKAHSRIVGESWPVCSARHLPNRAPFEKLLLGYAFSTKLPICNSYASWHCTSPVRRPGFHLHPSCNATGQRRYLSMVQWKKKTPAAGPDTPKNWIKLVVCVHVSPFPMVGVFRFHIWFFRGDISHGKKQRPFVGRIVARILIMDMYTRYHLGSYDHLLCPLLVQCLCLQHTKILPPEKISGTAQDYAVNSFSGYLECFPMWMIQIVIVSMINLSKEPPQVSVSLITTYEYM